MGDLISVRGIQARGRHGALPGEQDQDQPFVVDLDVGCDLLPSACSDDLDDTLSYAELTQLVVRVVEGPSAHLVETLAGHIAEAVLLAERAEFVQVSVHKPEAPLGVAVSDVAVRVRRERERQAVVALGANLGDRAATLARAVADLGALDGVRVRAVSAFVDTAPVGPPQPDYLNAVAIVTTRLHPQTLLRELQAIEAAHGRRRDEPAVLNGPRTLDLDLIQVGDPAQDADLHGVYGELVLPHPRAHQRSFVLEPWYDVQPWAVLRTPQGPVPVGELLAARSAQERGTSW